MHGGQGSAVGPRTITLCYTGDRAQRESECTRRASQSIGCACARTHTQWNRTARGARRDTSQVLGEVALWPLAVAGMLPGIRPSNCPDSTAPTPLPRLHCPGSLLTRREKPIADLDADGGDVITVITLLLAPLGRSCLDELRDRLLMHAITPIRPAGIRESAQGSQRTSPGYQARRWAATHEILGRVGGAPVRKGSSARGSGRVHTVEPLLMDLATRSTTCCESMNSHTPSEAITMNPLARLSKCTTCTQGPPSDAAIRGTHEGAHDGAS